MEGDCPLEMHLDVEVLLGFGSITVEDLQEELLCIITRTSR